MKAKPRTLVFDSWAIIAYFEDEPAGKIIEEIIIDANEREIPMYMSVVNAGEVWYIVARQTSPSEADSIISDLRSLGIQFENPDWKASRQAAVFKSKHKMSYADAYAAALAIQKNAHLVTGDNEFKQVEKEIKILWV